VLAALCGRETALAAILLRAATAIGLALRQGTVVVGEVGIERSAFCCGLVTEALSVSCVVGLSLRARIALNALGGAYALTFVARETRNVGR